jgi:hypothetical protein
MWENTAELDRPQIAIWHMALHGGYSTAGQATDCNMAHGHCMVDIVQLDRPKFAIWHMALHAEYSTAGQATDCNMAHGTACWIHKATNTHSEYVILIAFHCYNGC